MKISFGAASIIWTPVLIFFFWEGIEGFYDLLYASHLLRNIIKKSRRHFQQGDKKVFKISSLSSTFFFIKFIRFFVPNARILFLIPFINAIYRGSYSMFKQEKYYTNLDSFVSIACTRHQVWNEDFSAKCFYQYQTSSSLHIPLLQFCCLVSTTSPSTIFSMHIQWVHYQALVWTMNLHYSFYMKPFLSVESKINTISY